MSSRPTRKPAKVRKRKRSPLLALSFVVDRKQAGLPPPTGKQSPLCFWHVHPKGSWADDNRTGEHLAVEWLTFERDGGAGCPCLQWLVSDMPRELTGIEVGFLTVIWKAAIHGAEGGLGLVRYWDDCRRKDALKVVGGQANG